MTELWHGLLASFAAALVGFYAVIPSLGVAIILLTVAVRLVLLPLTIRQTRSMREMGRLQPEMQKIRQKYKDNRQKQQEEVMALYREHGVNPFGGCAPLLLQIPVLIALFYVIRDPLEYMSQLRESALASDLASRALEVNSFVGLRLDCTADLARTGQGTPTVAEACGSGWLSMVPYLGLVVLMGLTTYYQQKQMQAAQGANNPQVQQMQMLTRIMPIMLMYFAYTFPAGVVLYWLTTNVWTIVQQRMMLQPGGAEPATAGAGSSSAESKRGKSGSSSGGSRSAKAGSSSPESKDGKPGSSSPASKDGKSRARRSSGSGKKKRRR